MRAIFFIGGPCQRFDKRGSAGTRQLRGHREHEAGDIARCDGFGGEDESCQRAQKRGLSWENVPWDVRLR